MPHPEGTLLAIPAGSVSAERALHLSGGHFTELKLLKWRHPVVLVTMVEHFRSHGMKSPEGNAS